MVFPFSKWLVLIRPVVAGFNRPLTALFRDWQFTPESIDNLWFANGTSEPGIQMESVEAWGRLLEVPVIRAVDK